MKHNLKLSVSLTILAGLAYALLAATVKHTAPMVPMPVMVFFQNTTALLLSLPFILRQDLPNISRILKTRCLGTHIVRTVASLSISYLLFYAVAKIPLVNAVLLANTAPLFVPFIGYLILREPINHRVWPSLLIGFLGVALILHPNLNAFNMNALYALGAGVCVATSMLLVRRAAAKDASITSAFYFFLFATMVSGIVAVLFWVPLTPLSMLILLGQGILFFVTQYFITLALEFSETQVVSTLFYSNVIFAAIISVIVWHTEISILLVAGILLAVVGGVLTIFVQNNRQRKIILTEI